MDLFQFCEPQRVRNQFRPLHARRSYDTHCAPRRKPQHKRGPRGFRARLVDRGISRVVVFVLKCLAPVIIRDVHNNGVDAVRGKNAFHFLDINHFSINYKPIRPQNSDFVMGGEIISNASWIIAFCALFVYLFNNLINYAYKLYVRGDLAELLGIECLFPLFLIFCLLPLAVTQCGIELRKAWRKNFVSYKLFVHGDSAIRIRDIVFCVLFEYENCPHESNGRDLNLNPTTIPPALLPKTTIDFVRYQKPVPCA